MQQHPTRTRVGTVAILTAALALSAFAAPPSRAIAAPGPCPVANRALQITPDCADATYANPVIDTTTDETSPVPHRRVSGHFEGTTIQFTIYLHPEADRDQWEGRFFQYTYPVTFTPGDSTARASDRAISFALSSGGYAVQAGSTSPSVGYRHTAAAAKFAEGVAADYYETTREISGYLYGPSGGSFQTIGAAENTTDIWQGFVPMVQAVPQPSSYQFQSRSAAELILDDEADAIRDALLPGGNGDPYATLDEAESTMLNELHALGVPWSAWQYPDYLFGTDRAYYGSPLDSDVPLGVDASYVDDFWGTDGYLGAEQSALGDRVRAELGERGDTVGNRWNIAKRFQYRYQVPAADQGWVALDQFRDADGNPIPPQRPIGQPSGAAFASGNTAFDGSISGKVIAISNLGDTDALPLHTDWYRQRIEASLGAAAADSYRLYYNENADHQDAAPVSGPRATFLVDWYGSVEQALRDVAAWAEDGVTPPDSTEYEIIDGQVVIPDGADERGGVQPLVDLGVNGATSVTVQVGQPVELQARTGVPTGAGAVVSAEWDLDGDGQYTDAGVVEGDGVFSISGIWREPGEYLAAVRVASERDGDAAARHALARNIDRVRVIVTEDVVISTAPVMIAGDARVGGTLTAEAGAWGPDGVALSYQWLADGQPIDGATGRELTLTAALGGRLVHVVVTGTAPAASPVTVTSDAVTVRPAPTAPTADPGSSDDGPSSPTAAPSGSDADHLSRTGVGTVLPAMALATLLTAAGVGVTMVARRRRSDAMG